MLLFGFFPRGHLEQVSILGGVDQFLEQEVLPTISYGIEIGSE